MLLLAVPAFALTTKSMNQGLTRDQVVALLAGPGATITNVQISGSDLAVGSFGAGADLGIDSGVVLSTGRIADAVGANTSPNTGVGLGTVGAPALDAIVKPFLTKDAAVIEFDVVTESPTFTIRYVFASEEYREFVDSEFNDVFAFFVNGANIALTPGSGEPVTINTINHLRNQGIYKDNAGGANTQFDGYTAPLLAVAVVEPGTTNHIRIAIADTSDDVLDSAVFIAQGGVSGSQIAPIIVPREDSIEAFFGSAGTDVDLPLFFAFESHPPTMSAAGIPGATITFSPLFRDATGQAFTKMNIVLGPDTPPGAHVVTIRAAVAGAESFATMIVVVDCQPPAILGSGQPQTQVVDRGTVATFRATATGSATHYQWYQGHSGMTRTPVPSNADGELRVVVNRLTPYWVRVTNPCGSYDSLTAFAIPR
ncbi:MAG TPA: choice-of-anchor L domain-containing protein [Thermoanaerobaculia bacterium]|nr:choice-of-anchor L domain-containing protein [Thermoanaerobaculia bacterium]